MNAVHSHTHTPPTSDYLYIIGLYMNIFWVRVNNDERSEKKGRKITKQNNIYDFCSVVLQCVRVAPRYFTVRARNAYIDHVARCTARYIRTYAVSYPQSTILHSSWRRQQRQHTVLNGSIVCGTCHGVETMIRTYYNEYIPYNVTTNTRVLIAYSQNTTCRLSMTVWLMKNWAVHTHTHTHKRTTKWASERVSEGVSEWTRKKNTRPLKKKILLLLLLFG